MQRLPIASAQTITLADQKEMAVVECNCERIRIKASDSHVWATNRFHDPDMLHYNVDTKDILTFSFSTGINYYDSRGLDYHHTYTNWYYRAEVMASYKRCV